MGLELAPAAIPPVGRLVPGHRKRPPTRLRIPDAAPAIPLASAARLLLALSLAYPGYCSYRTLFAALYPADEGEMQRVWESEFAIRPIRRSTMALAPALQRLGLAILSLRGRGYWLACAPNSAFRSDAIILEAGIAQDSTAL